MNESIRPAADPAGRDALPLNRAAALASRAEAMVRALASGVAGVEPSGELRRVEPVVSHVELVVAALDPAALFRALAGLDSFDPRRSSSGRFAAVRIDNHAVTLHLTHPDRYAVRQIACTGSPRHVAQLAARAASRGYRLTEDELAGPNEAVACETESDVYARLGLPLIPPELRDGGDELEFAESGSLGGLVRLEDIRGDLHMHTDWSDGRGSIEAMARAALERGYEYIAITDHSQAAAIDHGLTVERLLGQAEAIESIRPRYPGLTILCGAEVDVLPDGQLDYPDDILRRLDIVLASLHEAPGATPEQVEQIYLGVIRHPLVNVVTHPTNRLIGMQEGYALDLARLIEAAAETGTALEIDGSPVHIDMDGPAAREAAGGGVTIAIDSDSHRPEHLARHMPYGVATARRGRVRREQVLNTRPLDDLLAFVLAKRRASGMARAGSGDRW